MRISITALLLAVWISALGGAPTKGAEPIEYAPTPGESASVALPVPSVEIYPKEIYLGDAIYLALYYENRSSQNVSISRIYGIDEYPNNKFRLSSPSLPGAYSWMQELRSTALLSSMRELRTLEPGQKYLETRAALEFPPLEDWNAPFWKELRAKIPEEGIVCTLHIADGAKFSQEILVKPRPGNETALLEQWYNATPETLLPRIDGKRKVPYGDWFLDAKSKSSIKIKGKKYHPWFFIRFAHRKPSDPNNPTTLEGWRELEASLAPSTMRDEVRFTRLQLEYYAAGKGEASKRAVAELVDWLNSLPKVQRDVMKASILSMRHEFEESSLRDEYRALTRALDDAL